MDWTHIISRPDGSYVISRNGHPYHVPNEGEFAELWREVNGHALAHPECVTPEADEPAGASEPDESNNTANQEQGHADI